MKTTKVLEQSLQISAPSWPLQNTVAVNPFWFLRDKPFHEVANELNPILETALYMPFSYYQQAIETEILSLAALEESIKINASLFPEIPTSAEVFIKAAAQAENSTESQKTVCELFYQGSHLHSHIILDFGKYASAYLDEKQAISVFPWIKDTFWNAWVQAQEFDRSMEFNGIKKFKESISCLKNLDSESAINLMLKNMGITNEKHQVSYMRKLLGTVLGWASQFKYVEWQKQLGYSVPSKARSVDLLAVRMAYDYSVFSGHSDPQSLLKKLCNQNINDSKNSTNYLRVLQFALELSYQKKISQNLNKNVSKAQTSYKAQVLFCIDVRSEMIRRNIEEINPEIQTIGFAGFFGVPFDYHSREESKPSHRLPVLLSPAFEVEEVPKPDNQNSKFSTLIQQISSYFRNLRKNPLSSFLYVELFGALYIEKVIRRSFQSLLNKLKGKQIPYRFRSRDCELKGNLLKDSQKVERAEAVLRHMGLVHSFSRIVLIMGHGSVTTNNAFGSSLDCGACGGHAGDINARFLADLLNDPAVRKGLVNCGITLPESTQFIAGIHETVTDKIYILEQNKVRPDLKDELSLILQDFETASKKTSLERWRSKPVALDPNADARSKNWSEVRPEWGLAGNACFIVAPRLRTVGFNLNSRSFLHDYDWKLDQAQDYKTLELIMTAPMVVTNWINLQYFASTVAPHVYGSGNKVLHNLVNETGVYEGNGGDLKFGLPIQSVHDGEKFVHEPLRLCVFIEAPRDQIENVIQKHEVVRQLVDHEWLHLIHIDPVTLNCSRRVVGGQYLPV